MSSPSFAAEGISRALSTNATTSVYPSTSDVTVAPPGFNMSGRTSILMWLFGTNTENEDFEFKVMGWWRSPLNWMSDELFVGTAVLSTQTGIVGGIVSGTELYADTITRIRGMAPYSIPTITANQKTSVRIDTLGADLVQVMFDIDAASTPVESANALYTLL